MKVAFLLVLIVMAVTVNVAAQGSGETRNADGFSDRGPMLTREGSDRAHREAQRHQVPRLDGLTIHQWKRAANGWRHRAQHRLELLRVKPWTVPQIICVVFGPDCSKAISVARCESGFSTTARNGQYLGIFQMGNYARALCGHSADALGQALSAHCLFRKSGWAPWECA